MRQRILLTPVSSQPYFFRSFSAAINACLLLLALLYNSNLLATEDSATNEIPSITWPLLPGENLNQLATLFYPDNRAMQRIFIRQTLTLNRDLHPQLKADQTFSQVTSIIVPELKALSSRATSSTNPPTTLQLKRQLDEKSVAIVTKAMWREYEALSQDNLQLQQRLDKLYGKLNQLQDSIQRLKLAAQARLQKRSASQDGSDQTPPAASTAVVQQNESAAADKSVSPIAAFSRPPLLISTLLALALFTVALFSVHLWRKHRYQDNSSAPKDSTHWLQTELQPLSTSPETTDTPPHPQEVSLGAEAARQQARIMIETGKPRAAMDMLKKVIETQSEVPLETWLDLLEIYRDSGLKTEFNELAQRLHQNFNVMMPQWEKVEVPLVVATSLEAFPHICEQLVKHWQEGSADTYLQNLLTDNRGGERTGFGPEVMQEILLLQGLLKNRE